MELSKARIVTMGDIIFKHNTDVLCSLGSIRSKDEIKEMLKDDWGIPNRESFLSALAWMSTQGHSLDYRQAAANKNEPHPFVEYYSERIGDKELKAWDLGRFASTSRYGLYVGYIGVDEFWELLRPQVQVLQDIYSSWEEYTYHYRLGRFFWIGRIEARHEDNCEFLLHNPNSPWQIIPWNTPVDTNKNTGEFHSPYVIHWDGENEYSNEQISDYLQRMSAGSRISRDYYCYGHHLGKLDDEDAALEQFLLAHQADPEDWYPYTGVTPLLRNDSARTEQLVSIYENWIKHFPDKVKPFHDYAIWLTYHKKDYEKANLMYLQAISLSDDSDTQLYTHYGQFLHQAVHEYERAIKIFEKVLSSFTHNRFPRESLGKLYDKVRPDW